MDAAFRRANGVGKRVQVELVAPIRQHRDFHLHLFAQLAERNWFREQRVSARRRRRAHEVGQAFLGVEGLCDDCLLLVVPHRQMQSQSSIEVRRCLKPPLERLAREVGVVVEDL